MYYAVRERTYTENCEHHCMDYCVKTKLCKNTETYVGKTLKHKVYGEGIIISVSDREHEYKTVACDSRGNIIGRYSKNTIQFTVKKVYCTMITVKFNSGEVRTIEGNYCFAKGLISIK